MSRGSDTLTAAEEAALARARTRVRASGPPRSGRSAPTGPPRRHRRAAGRGRSATRRRPTLDALRGGALVVALVVAGAGSTDGLPGVLRPSTWHGLSVADLVGPALLVVSGAAFAAGGRDDARRWARRLAVLLAVGAVFAFGAADLDPDRARWLGPLPRLAVTGAVVAALVRRPLSEQVVAAVAALVVHTVWLTDDLVGRGAAALTPHLNPARQLDLDVIGAAHVARPTDPENLLSWLPALVLVLAGRWLGRWLVARPSGPATAAALVLAAGWCAAAALLWGQILPFNPTLLTASTVLAVIAVVLAATALTHLALERWDASRGLAWLTRLGRHALPAGSVAFGLVLAARVTDRWDPLVEGFARPVFGGAGDLVLGVAVAGLAVWIAGRLDRRAWSLTA